jgi:hypothetical protein
VQDLGPIDRVDTTLVVDREKGLVDSGAFRLH